MDVDETTFGEVLRRFRHRKGLTQHQLASRIGASRNSISYWERGDFLPEALSTILELARVLDLCEEERRFLVEARFGTASVLPFHRFPSERNPYFTGRETVLERLHEQLTEGKTMALSQAITGLGGIGKTQVALEYAYRYQHNYHDILWVAAQTREHLVTSYVECARLLRLREQQEQDQGRIVEAVKRWFREHRGWLLILDNIEDLALVREFVPPPRPGVVLLTTRRQQTSPVAQALVLDVLSREEGALFLLKRVGLLPLDAELEDASSSDVQMAQAIVQSVEGLPLAIDQAGAYIAETKCSLSDYLDVFKREQKALLLRRGTVPTDHPQPVTTTFALAFEQVKLKNEAALSLLTLCAFLAPDAIPLEVITNGAIHVGSIIQDVAANPLQLDQALETLQLYSLVQRDAENRTLTLHRLVQAVLQEALEGPEKRMWRERTVKAVNAAFPRAHQGTWSQCERLLPQTFLSAQYIRMEHFLGEEAGRLLFEAASYLSDRARYEEARALFEQALRIREQSLGETHPEVAYPLHGLASLSREQGQYEEAKTLFERALCIREQSLGLEHPDVAYPLQGLAILYGQQGKYVEAEPLFERVLHIREQNLGQTHPDVAYPLHGLANLFLLQGKYAEAEPLYQRALHIREQSLGPDHPQMAYPLHGLAILYREQGKYAEAEPLFERALCIFEQQWGETHPEVAYPLQNLASLYRVQKQYEEAKTLFERALHIREQNLGPDHPQVAYPLHGLAILYGQQGKYAEAELLFERALHIREQSLGQTHPDVAYPLQGLAILYGQQGRDTEAELFFERALHIREQNLGPEHPEIAETLHDLATFRERQGNRKLALALYQRAFAIREQRLGETHPKTRATRQCLDALMLEENETRRQ